MEEDLLTTEEVLLLENLTYFEGISLTEYQGRTVGNYLEGIDMDTLDLDAYYGPYMTGQDYKDMFNAIMNDPNIRDMEIAIADADDAPLYGSRANRAVFINESTGEAVVAYMGTGEGEEWKDNFTGGGPTSREDGVSTLQQERALEWYQEVYGDCNLENYYVTVTGHSKGGNKAQYVTLLDDTVDRCLSFDGQGFSDEFIHKYAPEIALRQGLIENHSLEYDFVNPLLNQVGKQRYYQGYGVDGFLENHCPNSFLNIDDEGNCSMNEVYERASAMDSFDDMLSGYIRSLSSEEREAAMDIIGTLAQGFFSGELKWNDIMKILKTSEGSETISGLLAYILRYEKEHPEFGDELDELLINFGYGDATKWVDFLTWFNESPLSDDALELLMSSLSNKIPVGDINVILDLLQEVFNKVDHVELCNGKDLEVSESGRVSGGWLIDSLNDMADIVSGIIPVDFTVYPDKLRTASGLLEECRDLIVTAEEATEKVSDMGTMTFKINLALFGLDNQLKREKRACDELATAARRVAQFYEATETNIQSSI